MHLCTYTMYYINHCYVIQYILTSTNLIYSQQKLMLCVTTQTTKQETCVNKMAAIIKESAFHQFEFFTNQNSALDEGVWTSEDILYLIDSRVNENDFIIPAQTTCPKSWTTEYVGYLMADHYTHKRNAVHVYECVDRNPESIPGSSSNVDGALFYL